MPCRPSIALWQSQTPIYLMDSDLHWEWYRDKALRTYDPLRALHLHIDRGPGERLHRMQIDDPKLSRAWWGGWVLLRAVLRESGVLLAGAAPAVLIDPVSPDELKQASLAVLDGWAGPLLDDPGQIKGRGYQSYCVLTLCRILYTLETGKITSKQAAARLMCHEKNTSPPGRLPVQR